MADDILVPVASPTTVATDEVGGKHYQKIKLVSGAADATDPIPGDSANGLDVDVTRVQGGNVAHGAADSGSPVKVGGKYNSTAPSLLDGQRSDLQVDDAGRLIAMLGALIAGEDPLSNRMAVRTRGTPFAISTATTTVVCPRAGHVNNIRVLGGTLGNVTIYNNTAGSGTVLVPTVTPVANGVLLENIDFETGLTIVTAAATIIIGSFE